MTGEKWKSIFEDLIVKEGLVKSRRELRAMPIKWTKYDGCVIANIGKKKKFVFAMRESMFARDCEKVGVPVIFIK